MADGFYTSPEFKNSGWLALNVYRVINGQLPNIALWLSKVTQLRNQTLTAAQLTDNLAGSASNPAFVQTAFQNGFGRAPNATELNANVANLNAGQSKFDFLNTVIFPGIEFISGTNGT